MGLISSFTGKDASRAHKRAGQIIRDYGEQSIEGRKQTMSQILSDIARSEGMSVDALMGGLDQASRDAAMQQMSAERAFRGAEAGALGDIQQGFTDAERALMGGLQDEQRLLGQAQGQFQDIAGLTGPALSNLQRTGTAGGRAQQISDILTDPNQQAAIQNIQDITGRQLSEAGLRRSGAGAQMSNQALMDFATSQADIENQRQQQLANMGIGGRSNIAALIGSQAGAAGAGGRDLSGLLTGGALSSAGVRQQAGQQVGASELGLGDLLARLGVQGGTGQADIIGRNLANTMGTRMATQEGISGDLGTIASGLAGAKIGAANARMQGYGNLLQTIAQQQQIANESASAFGDLMGGAGSMVGGMMASDRRLKQDVKRIDSDKFGGIYSWVWNEKANELGLYGRSEGRIAQELMEDNPEFVTMSDNGYYMVNYGAIDKARAQ